MPNFKHIIWDWNGTLLDDAKLCWEIINEIIVENNIRPIDFSEYLEVFTFPVKEYYKAVGLPTEKGEFERLGKIFIERYEERKPKAKLHSKASEILKTFSEENLSQYILSAYSQKNLEETIKYYGIEKFFTRVKGLSNIYAHGKVEIGKELIDEIDTDKSGIILVGDTLHDAEVATQLGIKAVLISSGHQNKNRLTKGNSQVISSLSELSEIILRNRK